jgi:hypothetical protein
LGRWSSPIQTGMKSGWTNMQAPDHNLNRLVQYEEASGGFKRVLNSSVQILI